jgi:hypothetical protein
VHLGSPSSWWLWSAVVVVEGWVDPTVLGPVAAEVATVVDVVCGAAVVVAPAAVVVVTDAAWSVIGSVGSSLLCSVRAHPPHLPPR